MRFLILVIFVFMQLHAFSTTIIVGQQKAVKSIKKGIELAKDGDTVKVMPGVYKEGSIIVKKSITLIGIHFPVIDGESKVENMLISGRQISISGFHFINSKHSSYIDYSAINIIDATKINISNNKITDAHFAIHVSNSTHCTIDRNSITGHATITQSAGNGIHIWKSANILVTNNGITGHRDGIYFEFVTHSDIRNNKSINNIRYGLHFMFSHYNHYAYNLFKNNGAGVAVMYTHHVSMENNIFTQNWGASSYGILLKDITDSKIINNQFLSNTTGILMEGCNRIDVKRNSFNHNGWAMKVQANCENNVISTNNFKNNTFDIATNGTSVMSSFDHNYWDKYEGYDLNKDGIGDVAYHPVSLYSMVIEKNPNALFLLRSFLVTLLDKVEKTMPAITPVELVDKKPTMKPFQL